MTEVLLRPDRRSPVLVTGTHRSGTTWVGRLLELSGDLLAVHEPFNPTNRRSWLANPAPHWFELVTAANAGRYHDDLARLIALRFPWRRRMSRACSTRDLLALGRDGLRAGRARVQQGALLMKDPLAFFSAPFFAETYDMLPIVCVRHPAAFVSSLKRLDWRFDFGNWTDQPLLMDGPLRRYADEIRWLAATERDIVDEGIALWKIMNSVVRDDYQHRPGWLVLRYEDIAADPERSVRSLYRSIGLRWSPTVEKNVCAYTQSSIQGELAPGDHMSVRRNSRTAMWTWLERLSPAEIARIRAGTAEIAGSFYSDADWAIETTSAHSRSSHAS